MMLKRILTTAAEALGLILIFALAYIYLVMIAVTLGY